MNEQLAGAILVALFLWGLYAFVKHRRKTKNTTERPGTVTPRKPRQEK